MRSPRSPMFLLLIGSALALASCTGNSAVLTPPVADLTPAPEPQLTAEALTSAAALDAFDTAHMAWGRGEHGKVSRLCAWFQQMGAKGINCGD